VVYQYWIPAFTLWNFGLTQTFATTPGQTYELSFAYADNYVTGTVHAASVSVFDSSGDLLGPTTISHYTSVAGDLNWTVFTANQATASLDFKSLDGFSYGGILLDGVSINAVPEPSSILLIGIGATGLIRYLRPRKAQPWTLHITLRGRQRSPFDPRS
jgi:hypothetical protein